MKQAILIHNSNIALLKDEINQISLETLFQNRGGWLVAEKFDEDHIAWNIMDDADFHEEYQLRPLPESLKDLRLDLWNPVAHRDEIYVPGIEYHLFYYEGDNPNLLVIPYTNRKDAVQTWDHWSKPESKFRPHHLNKIETIRSAE